MKFDKNDLITELDKKRIDNHIRCWLYLVISISFLTYRMCNMHSNTHYYATVTLAFSVYHYFKIGVFEKAIKMVRSGDYQEDLL